MPLQCPFPFEGNWNQPQKVYIGVRISSYNVLSRLKGIETPIIMDSTDGPAFNLQCPFPFEGNWNLFQQILGIPLPHSYNVLSRLKGIETDLRKAL